MLVGLVSPFTTVSANEGSANGITIIEKGKDNLEYIQKKKDRDTSYSFRDTPTSENDIAGLFFQIKGDEEWNGVFAFFRNGRMIYLQIKQARVQLDEINEEQILN